MTVQNGEKYLNESILSLLEQSFSDTELVVVDNGSTDCTSKILENINDKRLKIISVEPSPQNTFASGIAKAFGAAIGEYVAVQDSDDISEKTRIEKQLQYLEAHPDVALVGSKFTVIDHSGKYLFTSTDLPESNELKQKYAEGNFLAHSSIMFRRKIISKIGGYNQNFEYACDYRLALDILNADHKISAINEPLIKIRRHADQETAKTNTGVIRNQNLLSLLQYAQNSTFLNRKSLLRGQRQITKAKFQGVLYLLRSGNKLNALKLFSEATLESPFYLIIYALIRTIRGQLNDAPQPIDNKIKKEINIK